ncbi:MAG: Ppx/GppA family phosphatase, partial [Robiginitomaculum sp.]|nr:Ppx/GppA family phosphatase [Robiginitomaculum sp.]
MADGTKPSSSGRGKAGKRRSGRSGQKTRKLYAALDLGTNNCRLLIATPSAGGFRVVDGLSRIVRLGEGLEQTEKLSEAAMDRALEALKACSFKLAKSKVKRIRAVATQACRIA